MQKATRRLTDLLAVGGDVQHAGAPPHGAVQEGLPRGRAGHRAVLELRGTQRGGW